MQVAILDAKTLLVLPDDGVELSSEALHRMWTMLKEVAPEYRAIVFAEGGTIRDFRDDPEATRLANELLARIETLPDPDEDAA